MPEFATPENEDSKNPAAARLGTLLQLCARRGPILVLMQDNPDPDAIASAAALRELIYLKINKRVEIGYGGACGRAENRAMMSVLRIVAKPLTPPQLHRYATIALVDAQPRSGNNILPEFRDADIVIDHHRLPKKRIWKSALSDVRPEYGACSTILYEYVREAGLRITPALATALFYGVQSDTQDLGREASPADVRAYSELFLLADKKKLARIRRAPVSREYFSMLAGAIAHTMIAGRTGICYVPECSTPEMIAEIADLLLRLEGVRRVICYGLCHETIFLSARALDARSNMAVHMRNIVHSLGAGGGHRTMAGGQVPVNGDPEKCLAAVEARILREFASRKPAIPLAPKIAPEAPRRRRSGDVKSSA